MKKRDDLIYPELSYKIVGILYDMFNNLGSGHKEYFYQKALAIAFTREKIKFQEKVHIPVTYKNEKVGKYFLDFLIDNKNVLEIKKDSIFRKQNIEQVYSYLKANNLKLGILANFTRTKVDYKRILNIK